MGVLRSDHGPDLRKLDVDAIAAMLSRRHPDVVLRDVEVRSRAACGDGVASTADRVVLGLDYARNDAGLPTQMVLKTLLLHPMLRFGLPVILSLSKATKTAESLPLVGTHARSLLFVLVGLYQKLYPHAPDAMYLDEVRFYADVRPGLAIEAPATYGSLFNEDNRHFGILMEDLTLRGARFPNATTEVTVDELRNLVGNLARLHAQFWDSPRFAGDLAWLPDRLSGGMYPVFAGIGRELVRYQVDQHEFKQELLRPLGRDVDTLWRDLWETQARLANSGPQTLLHGDTHIANTYLLPDGTGGLLDWQLTVRGNWVNDLTYMIVTGLEPETRATFERELISYYLDELGRHGVRDVPDPVDAWEHYRLAIIWGLVIGWLITPPANYGEEITAANICRLVTAAVDVASFEAATSLR